MKLLPFKKDTGPAAPSVEPCGSVKVLRQPGELEDAVSRAISFETLVARQAARRIARYQEIIGFSMATPVAQIEE